MNQEKTQELIALETNAIVENIVEEVETLPADIRADVLKSISEVIKELAEEAFFQKLLTEEFRQQQKLWSESGKKDIPQWEDFKNWLETIPKETLRFLRNRGKVHLLLIPPGSQVDMIQAICESNRPDLAKPPYAVIHAEEWKKIGESNRYWRMGLTSLADEEDRQKLLFDPSASDEEAKARTNDEVLEILQNRWKKYGLTSMPADAGVPALLETISRPFQIVGISGREILLSAGLSIGCNYNLSGTKSTIEFNRYEGEKSYNGMTAYPWIESSPIQR